MNPPLKHVYPPRHPASLDTPPDGATSASRDRAREPALPHEHDESSHSQASQPREVIQQAKADLDRGLVDTDRSKPMDELYQKTLRGDKGSPAR